jgi:hypothetical protein
MSNYFAIARAFLANLDPAAPAAALILTVFLTIYSLRRFAPKAWLWIEAKLPFVDTLDYRPFATIVSKFVQSLPGALLGVVVASLSSGASVKSAVIGVLSGFAASLVHEVMAAYKGQVSTPKPPTMAKPYTPERPMTIIDKGPPSVPPAAAFVGRMLGFASAVVLLSCASLVASLTGCSFFTHSVEPIAKECAPSAAELVSQVSQILLSGGNYEAEIEQLILVDGESTVLCAIRAVIADLTAKSGKVGASPDDGAAVARGKAYLAKHQEAQ